MSDYYAPNQQVVGQEPGIPREDPEPEPKASESPPEEAVEEESG